MLRQVPWNIRRGPRLWEGRLKAHYRQRGVKVTEAYLRCWTCASEYSCNVQQWSNWYQEATSKHDRADERVHVTPA